MKQFFFFVTVLCLGLMSCKKDATTNQLVTKKIKTVTTFSSDSKIKKQTTYLYDSSDELVSTIFTEIDTTTSAASSDTVRIIDFVYTNNLPNQTTITTHKNIGGTWLSNVYNRYYMFDAQNRIVLDSLVSYNLQYPFSGSNAYQDTIAYLTNRSASYSNNTQYTTFYNSALLNSNFVWVNDTALYTNGNLTLENNLTQTNSKTYYFTKSATYNNYDNPLFTGIVPQFGQSQKLPSNETYQYNQFNIPITYSYVVDANGNVLSSVQNTYNTTTLAAISITSYYDYY